LQFRKLCHTFVSNTFGMDNGKDMEARIIEAATQVFLEKGYEGSNMTLIAEAAGIGRPALYYYFRTKDKIYNELFGALIRDFIPSVVSILQLDVPMTERIDKLVDAYFEQLKKNPRLPFFLIREANRDPQFLLQTALQQQAGNWVQTIQQIFQHEIENGNVKPIPVFTIIFTVLGQVVFPFLAKPLLETVFPDEGFEQIIAIWKPCVAESLKHLLLPE